MKLRLEATDLIRVFFYLKINKMAKEKKSFLLYVDLIHTIEKLNDEQTGRLFKHILRYVNDQDPEAQDQFTEVVFEPIKQSLKRDLVKYEGIRERNKENANKRWNAKDCDRMPPHATAANRIPKRAKNAVSDSDKDKDKDIDIYRAFAHLKLTVQDFDKLRVDYSVIQIDNVLDNIENFKSNKNYSSLFLTAKNWLKRDVQKNEVETSDDRFYKNVMAQIAKDEQNLKNQKNVN
jgi:hypothetical protein